MFVYAPTRIIADKYFMINDFPTIDVATIH